MNVVVASCSLQLYSYSLYPWTQCSPSPPIDTLAMVRRDGDRQKPKRSLSTCVFLQCQTKKKFQNFLVSVILSRSRWIINFSDPNGQRTFGLIFFTEVSFDVWSWEASSARRMCPPGVGSQIGLSRLITGNGSGTTPANDRIGCGDLLFLPSPPADAT